MTAKFIFFLKNGTAFIKYYFHNKFFNFHCFIVSGVCVELIARNLKSSKNLIFLLLLKSGFKLNFNGFFFGRFRRIFIINFIFQEVSIIFFIAF